jgi:phosphocarrier protein
MPRVEKKISIKSRQGLHARPAALFVQIANRFESAVTVRRGQEEVNGKSIMGILMLGADKGSEVVLITEGKDAEQAFSDLENFLGKEEL